MFNWLLKKIFKVKSRQLKKAYDEGLGKGYELGYKMGQVEKNNRGFIMGCNLDKQIDEILKSKDF